MKKLERYYDSIVSQKKLKFSEAKDLYIKILNTKDEKEKKQYMDELILGTMYVIYNYIDNNDFSMFENSTYDLDDILNTFIEVWINKINEGVLLKYHSYSIILNSSFISEVNKKLNSSNIEIMKEFDIVSDYFATLFYNYIELKRSKTDFSYTDLLIKSNYKNTFLKLKSDLMIIFEKIYDNLNIDDDQEIDLSPTKIRNYINLFVNLGMVDNLTEDVVSDENMEEKIEKEVDFIPFMDDVKSVLNDKRKISIIEQRFGLNDEEERIFSEIGKEFNISKARVREIENRSLRDLRSSKEIKKYKNML